MIPFFRKATPRSRAGPGREARAHGRKAKGGLGPREPRAVEQQEQEGPQSPEKRSSVPTGKARPSPFPNNQMSNLCVISAYIQRSLNWKAASF